MFESKQFIFDTAKQLYEMCEKIANDVTDKLCENDAYFNFHIEYNARFDYIELTVERENVGDEKCKTMSLEINDTDVANNYTDNVTIYSGTHDDMKQVTRCKLDYNWLEWLIRCFLQ